MYKGILHLHYLVVTLFFILYVVKTILLLSGRNEVLANFTKRTKIFEMILSVLFLVSGIYLTTKLPFGGKYDYLFWIKLVVIAAAIPIAIVGFKKGNKIMAAASLVLITAAYGLAEVYAKRKGIARPVKTEMANETDGLELYRVNCALCHGNDGKLGAAGAKDISATPLNVEEMKNVILKGQGNMAPIRVSEAQAETIAQYVEQNLKGR